MVIEQVSLAATQREEIGAMLDKRRRRYRCSDPSVAREPDAPAAGNIPDIADFMAGARACRRVPKPRPRSACRRGRCACIAPDAPVYIHRRSDPGRENG